METRHETVLLQESVDALSVVSGDVVVDATLGGAGHFMALAKALGKGGMLVLVAHVVLFWRYTKDASPWLCQIVLALLSPLAPVGATTIIPQTGKGYPVKGEDFGYLVWRKRNCCML